MSPATSYQSPNGHGYTEQWRSCWTDAGWDRSKSVNPEKRGDSHDLHHPVVGMSWPEAAAYCRWLTVRLREAGEIGPDQEVRLPSEAEWEKAARGTDARIYPWGNEPDPNRANYADTGIRTTSVVGCFPGGASPYGCEEMSGNVWEWCATKFEGYGYAVYVGDNDPEGSDDRMLRGGAFGSSSGGVRCACRHFDEFGAFDIDFGFRVCVVARQE